jgi:hypothetical protein
MKRENLIRMGFVLIVAFSSSAGVRASGPGFGPFAQMQSAAPGAAHKQLAKRAGEYTTVTGLMNLTWTSKDDGTTVNFAASFNDDSGAKQVFEVATRQLDDNHFVVRLYAKNPDGSRGPAFETTFTRKK